MQLRQFPLKLDTTRLRSWGPSEPCAFCPQSTGVVHAVDGPLRKTRGRSYWPVYNRQATMKATHDLVFLSHVQLAAGGWSGAVVGSSVHGQGWLGLPWLCMASPSGWLNTQLVSNVISHTLAILFRCNSTVWEEHCSYANVFRGRWIW